MGSILSIDYGLKRIGLAFSDENRIFAFPYGVIENINKKQVLSEIKNIVNEKEIDLIIVGMPFNMDKTKGEMAHKVEEFIDVLKKEISKEIITRDERLTSFAAEENLREANVSGKKIRKFIDAEAARIILEEFS